MSARFITSLLAAGALVVSLAAASPVQAGHDKNVKRFVGAAIGLYILGQALENNNRGRVVRHHNSHRKVYRNHHRHGGKWKQRNGRRDNCRYNGRHNRCW
ncbi:hypothetical protein [Antarctobacter sp.]|uniref:hypothetical protein n=1 Tax=Antarctobacter sp. TaxID=1872577 RepID=UPI002B26C252|nr:hypothetical protein [Antarctobacter sp.]